MSRGASWCGQASQASAGSQQNTGGGEGEVIIISRDLGSASSKA